MSESALAHECAVCGVPFSGAAGTLSRWIGIKRSSRSPNACTRCNTHIEEGRLAEMTVLFADLSSFTQMTHDLGAAPTYDVVDAFLREASAVLGRHGAYIDKFIGDAVMAFFNVPIKSEDHARRAVAAALEIQGMLPALSARLGVPLKAAVGISTGMARVGRLGSDEMKDYTAIGDAVNMAARLQAQARAGEILVAAEVYEKAKDLQPGLPAERLALKGFAEPAAAFRMNAAGALPAPSELQAAAPRPLGWGALVLAFLGAGCAAGTALAAASVVLGAGSLAVFIAAFRWLDHHPLRLPALAAALVLSAFNVWLAWTAAGQAGKVKGLTRREKRSLKAAAAAGAVTAVLAVAELMLHYRHHGRVF